MCPKNTTKDCPENDWNNCHVCKVDDIDLVECLEKKKIECQWILPFGDSNFCKHPLAKEYAKEGLNK